MDSLSKCVCALCEKNSWCDWCSFCSCWICDNCFNKHQDEEMEKLERDVKLRNIKSWQ